MNLGQPPNPDPYSHMYTRPQPQGTWFSHLYQQTNQAEVQQFAAWFHAIDRDRSGKIGIPELCLIQFGGRNLSVTTAQCLMRAFDHSREGSLGFWEYVAMHKLILQVQQAFVAADRDRSGRIDVNEAGSVLTYCGFHMHPSCTTIFVRSFDRAKVGSLDFEAVLGMVATLGHLRTLFTFNDRERKGMVTLSFDQLAAIIADFVGF